MQISENVAEKPSEVLKGFTGVGRTKIKSPENQQGLREIGKFLPYSGLETKKATLAQLQIILSLKLN